jgi:outer membrane protein assembly factor BamB
VKTISVALVILTGVLLVLVPVSCRKNHPPDTPTTPVGSATCAKDTVYTFTTAADDPDDHSVALRIDWGDGQRTDWTAPVPGGENVAFTHAWADTGTYEVRAQARDERELHSDWSGAAVVAVIIARLPGIPVTPLGPARGGKDSACSFGSAATDPDGDSVSLGFLWGDGDTMEWSPLVASGETAWLGHTWSVADTYAVTARARDKGGGLSAWSGQHTIDIRPPDTLCKWRFTLSTRPGVSIHSNPAVGSDGVVYIGSPDSAVYAVNPDGTLRWRYPTGGSVSSSPTIGPDGTVYVGSNDGNVYALNTDGALEWQYPTGHAIYHSPAIGSDGTIYAGGKSLCALNPDGSVKWEYNVTRSVYPSPAVAPDGTIYLGSDECYVVALNPDGNPKWRYFAGDDVRSSPAIDVDGTVYVHADDGLLYAFNSDSTVKWSLHVSDHPRTVSPAIGPDGTVYIGGSDGLSAITPGGTLRWSYPGANSYYATPLVGADETIYAGSTDGSLYCLNSDGTLRWKYAAYDNIEDSPTIGPDGTIYFAADDGCLYALKDSVSLADSPWPKFHHDLRNTGRVGGR